MVEDLVGFSRVAFDWCCDDAQTDLGAVRGVVGSYLSAGGPGRVTALDDFSMLLASRLNFLLSKVRLTLDPHDRKSTPSWAEREIDVAVHIMPTPGQLADVFAVTRGCVR